jgi:hypothetical protein
MGKRDVLETDFAAHLNVFITYCLVNKSDEKAFYYPGFI